MRISDWSSDVCSSDLADGPEQIADLGLTCEHRGDAAPQQTQRLETLLPGGRNKRAAELDRRPGLRDQAGVIAKQRTRVQTVDIVPRNNRIGAAEAIRADELASLRMPEKQVHGMWIETVQTAHQTTGSGKGTDRER